MEGGASGLRLQGAAAGVAAAGVSLALLPQPAALFGAGLAIVAALVAVVDLERYIIPDSASAAILLGGFGLCLIDTTTDPVGAIADAALRAAVAGGALYLLRALYRQATGVLGLGLGDVKLAAAGAPWLGWQWLPVAVELAAVGALVAVGLSALRTGEKPQRGLALPLGAFLAPALWISFFVERWGVGVPF